MTQLPLLTGFYQSRSVIASAQRCLNLYPEINTPESYMVMPQMTASAIVTLYPTPGTRMLGSLTPAQQGPGRGLYYASNNQLYAVIGNTVYHIDPQWRYTILGYIMRGSTPVSMSDNAVTAVLVDGTSTGYTIDLASNTFGTIEDSTGSFVGADKVDYIDGYFLFNKPGTPQFYASLAQSVTFDNLYFANKNAAPDWLETIVVNQRQIWLIGQQTTELWYDSGASDFPFEINSSYFIQHGCIAKYSVAKQDSNIFWLGNDPQGGRIVLQGVDLQAVRVSTHAIENEIQNYPRVDDAVGFCYQQLGHSFYVLTFPTADKTWVYDIEQSIWHERAVIDGAGQEHRIRANGYAYAYGKHVVIDYATGALYEMSADVYTDLGQPIRRERTFPHLVNELKRIIYRGFRADMETGAPTTSTNYANVSSPVLASAPLLEIGFYEPPAAGNNGVPLAFNGTVNPADNAVEIAFSISNTTPPTTGWTAATVNGDGAWTGTITPT